MNHILKHLQALATNPQATIDKHDMQWLQEVARAALASIESKSHDLVFTEDSLESFHSKVEVLPNGSVSNLQAGCNAAFLSLLPNSFSGLEFTDHAMESFYSKADIDKSGIIQGLKAGLRAVALATPALNSIFREPLDGPTLLEIARENGLRGVMHGINATDAKALLSRFVDAVDSRRGDQTHTPNPTMVEPVVTTTAPSPKQFEVTAAGFDGGTDATDGRVFWVQAPDEASILQTVEGLGAVVIELDVAISIEHFDYHLPRQASELAAACKSFQDSEHNTPTHRQG